MVENPNVHDELLLRARDYQVPDRAVQLLGSHLPVIIAGVTASGKNAVINYMMRHGNHQHVITHTTRPMRTKENNGVEHWFATEEEMLELVNQNALIECQPIHGDSVYGTSFSAFEEVLSSDHKPLMELDIQGINDLTAKIPHLEPIFILPPSFDIWMERLGGRDFMSDGERIRRLRSAKIEIEEALKNKSFILLINHELDQTAQEIMSGVSSLSYDPSQSRKLADELLEYLRSY